MVLQEDFRFKEWNVFYKQKYNATEEQKQAAQEKIKMMKELAAKIKSKKYTEVELA